MINISLNFTYKYCIFVKLCINGIMNSGGNMRIDKFLKNSRLIKRRTVAKEACDSGRVSVNGKVVKAGHEIKLEDIIEIRFGENVLRAQVLDLRETSFKDQAKEMFKIIGD